jgi:ribosomal protein S24E
VHIHQAKFLSSDPNSEREEVRRDVCVPGIKNRPSEIDQNQKKLEYLRSQLEANEKLVKVQEIYYRAGEGSTAAMLSLYEQQKSFEHQIELLEATVEYQQSK